MSYMLMHRDDFPTEVNRRFEEIGVSEGDPISLEVENGSVVITPIEIDPDQAWFWTEEWQAGEREVNEEVARGGGRVFYSDEEFLAHLDREAD